MAIIDSYNITRNYTGDGVTNSFAVTSGLSYKKILVHKNNVLQLHGRNFTISGPTLTFLITPANGDTITIRELPA